MNRIRSYTVIEMMVVMLISSLGIGIAYTCYTIFSNHYLSYKKHSDELAEYILMDKLITKDVSASSRVEKISEGIVCRYKKKNVQYEFYQNYVLRRAEIIDTFHIQSTGEPVFKRLGKTENIPGALLEEISFDTKYKDERLYFYYKKQYGADLLMGMEEADKQ